MLVMVLLVMVLGGSASLIHPAPASRPTPRANIRKSTPEKVSTQLRMAKDSSRTIRRTRVPAVSMQLQMPEDGSTIDRLIERTRENLREGLIVVLHFSDPTTELDPYASNPWAEPMYGSSTPSASSVLQVATAYADSAKYGGRPLVVLQIDRDLPGMDVICSQRRIVTFPTIQIFSRGEGEVVAPGELERRLLALGVASKSKPARRDGGFVAVGAGPRARSAASTGPPVDFLGVGSGDAPPSQGSGDSVAGAGAAREGTRNPQRQSPARPLAQEETSHRAVRGHAHSR